MSEVAQDKVLLSVVIKTYNEEEKIKGCLQSILDATKDMSCEIILADSLSTDNTVQIASEFPISIVQLKNEEDRCCGVGGQIGFLQAKGEYLLMIDGDMLLRSGFVEAAIKEINKTPKLAAVGGFLSEKSDSIDYAQRMERKTAPTTAGEMSHLSGGGLYSMEALRSIGYFTNLNFHACEELDVGLRLNAKGWKVQRISTYWVDHFGHEEPLLLLTKKRLKSGVFSGVGELLRASYGRPYFFKIVWKHIHLLLTMFWWLVVLFLCVVGSVTSLAPFLYFLMAAVILMPIVILIFKKKSLKVGLYSFLTWNVQAYATIVGLLRSQRDPLSEVPVNILR